VFAPLNTVDYHLRKVFQKVGDPELGTAAADERHADPGSQRAAFRKRR
jgi:hypothetical protein